MLEYFPAVQGIWTPRSYQGLWGNLSTPYISVSSPVLERSWRVSVVL